MGTIFRNSHVVTRRDHLCWGCCIIYPKGSNMLSQAGTDDDGIYTAWTCRICQKVSSNLRDADFDYICAGELRTGDPETWRKAAVSLGLWNDIVILEPVKIKEDR